MEQDKSTLMRIITGIYKPDFGTVKIDDMNAFDNDDAKRLFYFIPDSTYFLRMQQQKRWRYTYHLFMKTLI